MYEVYIDRMSRPGEEPELVTDDHIEVVRCIRYAARAPEDLISASIMHTGTHAWATMLEFTPGAIVCTLVNLGN